MTPTQIQQDLMDTSGESAVPHDAIRRWCRESRWSTHNHHHSRKCKKKVHDPVFQDEGIQILFTNAHFACNTLSFFNNIL